MIRSEYVFNSAATWQISVIAFPPTKFVVAYRDGDGAAPGTAVAGDIPFSNLVGIAKESRTAGQTVPVITAGTSDVHSGLTSGAVYYTDEAGSLTLSITDWRVGLAISATEILLNSNRDNDGQFF